MKKTLIALTVLTSLSFAEPSKFSENIKVDCSKYLNSDFIKFKKNGPIENIKSLNEYKEKYDSLNKSNVKAFEHNKRVIYCWEKNYIEHIFKLVYQIENNKNKGTK